MTNSRKKQIAWWACKVYEQSLEYADIIDPKRTKANTTANQLDAVARIVKRIHFELTGELPKPHVVSNREVA